MNLDQWDKLHKRVAPGVKVNSDSVRSYLFSSDPRDVFDLIVMMARAEYSEDAYREYCDFIVAELGGYQ